MIGSNKLYIYIYIYIYKCIRYYLKILSYATRCTFPFLVIRYRLLNNHVRPSSNNPRWINKIHERYGTKTADSHVPRESSDERYYCAGVCGCLSSRRTVFLWVFSCEMKAVITNCRFECRECDRVSKRDMYRVTEIPYRVINRRYILRSNRAVDSR